jgi:plasmid stability protein
MATLYVENVPDELYEALRSRAKRHRKSIAGEVISLLEENVPTEAQLAKRRGLYEYVTKLKQSAPPAIGTSPSTEEMIREDRDR